MTRLVYFYAVLCSAALAVAQGTAEPGRAAGDELRALPFEVADSLRARKVRGFKAEVAQRIFSAEEGGEIAVAAWAVPLSRGDTGTSYVPLLVEIDGAGYLRHNQSAAGWLEIYAYAVTTDGAVAGHLSEAVAIDVAALGEQLTRGGVKYYGHLELPPGEYDLRVLVRDPQSGAGGVRHFLARR